MSYDVSSLFTNAPVDETIDILVERAFNDDWFNKTHGTNLQPSQLREILQVAVKNQLFQFDGNFYEQVDGVAVGSPLGPLMANTFMSSIEANFLQCLVKIVVLERFHSVYLVFMILLLIERLLRDA